MSVGFVEDTLSSIFSCLMATGDDIFETEGVTLLFDVLIKSELVCARGYLFMYFDCLSLCG